MKDLSQQRRIELIKQIEAERTSRVLTCIISDPSPTSQGVIGDDTIRRISEHLRAMGPVERLDVFLFSGSGGIGDLPSTLATAFREVSQEWNLLVPFRPISSAKLRALGVNTIYLGRQADTSLPVKMAPPVLDDLMCELWGQYEQDFPLRQPFEPSQAVSASDRHAERTTLAIVESASATHECTGTVEVSAKRQMPDNLTVNVEMPLKLNVNPATLPAELHTILEAFHQRVVEEASLAAHQALTRRAPRVGTEVSVRDRTWRLNPAEVSQDGKGWSAPPADQDR